MLPIFSRACTHFDLVYNYGFAFHTSRMYYALRYRRGYLYAKLNKRLQGLHPRPHENGGFKVWVANLARSFTIPPRRRQRDQDARPVRIGYVSELNKGGLV